MASSAGAFGGGFSQLGSFISMLLQMNQQQGQFDTKQEFAVEGRDIQASQFAEELAQNQGIADSADVLAGRRAGALETQADAQLLNSQVGEMKHAGISGDVGAFADFAANGIPTPGSRSLDAISNLPIPGGLGLPTLPDFGEISREMAQKEKSAQTQTAFAGASKNQSRQLIEGSQGLFANPQAGLGGTTSAGIKAGTDANKLQLAVAEFKSKRINEIIDNFRQQANGPVLVAQINSIMTSDRTRSDKIVEAMRIAGGVLQAEFEELNTTLAGLGQTPVDIMNFLQRIAQGSDVTLSDPGATAAQDGFKRFNESLEVDMQVTFEEYRQMGYPGLRNRGDPSGVGSVNPSTSTGDEALDALIRSFGAQGIGF